MNTQGSILFFYLPLRSILPSKMDAPVEVDTQARTLLRALNYLFSF